MQICQYRTLTPREAPSPRRHGDARWQQPVAGRGVRAGRGRKPRNKHAGRVEKRDGRRRNRRGGRSGPNPRVRPIPGPQGLRGLRGSTRGFDSVTFRNAGGRKLGAMRLGGTLLALRALLAARRDPRPAAPQPRRRLAGPAQPRPGPASPPGLSLRLPRPSFQVPPIDSFDKFGRFWDVKGSKVRALFNSAAVADGGATAQWGRPRLAGSAPSPAFSSAATPGAPLGPPRAGGWPVPGQSAPRSSRGRVEVARSVWTRSARGRPRHAREAVPGPFLASGTTPPPPRPALRL